MSMHTKAAIATVLAQAAALAAAHAQQAADRPTTEVLQEVVVTGSLIKRAVGDVAQPVTTLQAEDLVASGATNAEQILQQIAQNQTLNVSNINLGADTGGGAYANLRALGSARTLVLLNGKRIVNSPFQTIGVDLNTLPTSLIERVEVLTDGGSATYGTDAIAGVMNFITAKERTGLTLSGTATLPEASGGGETYLASIGGGFGSLAADGWNVYAGGSWRKARELPQTARDFSRTGFLPERGLNRLNATTFPANYSQPASGITNVNPTSPACDPPFSLFGNGGFGPSSCAYDQLAHIALLTPQEQWSALGKVSVRLGEQHVASLEYVRAENEVFSIISPQGVNSLTMTSANPFYPGQGITPGAAGLNPALPIIFNVRTTELGERENTFEGYTDRALLQLEGEAAGWEYQLSTMTSSSEVEVVFTNGFPDELRLRDGFSGANGAPFLNPFGPQTPAGLQFLRDIEVVGEAQRAEGELRLHSLQLNRDLFDLPAGPLAVAIAFEYKEDEAEFHSNPEIAVRVPSQRVAARPDAFGSRDAASMAIETNVPLLESLEVGLALRYDDYSDFGDTTNPEFSVRYEPFDALVLRGSYSTGFRAPTLYDVFAPSSQQTTISRFNDPLLCPGGTANPAAGGVQFRDCNIQFDRLVGGNRDLEAEESQALSVGFVLRPLPGLSLGIDYWDYHLEQTISPLSEQAIFANPVKYADLIFRCSEVPVEQWPQYDACLVPGGDPIAYVKNVVDNLGDTKTSGFDGTAEWTGPDVAFGRFGVRYRGTYVAKYEFQREPGGPFFSRAGRYFDTFPVIRYVHFLTFSWERGPWSAGLTHRYKSAYTDCNAQCQITPTFFNEVDADSIWDLSAAYRGFDQVTLSATIVNLLDEEPPFSNKNTGLSTGFDDRYADGRLRTYLLTATYKF